MGTRSMIGMETDNGIQAVYCHWDGYPSNNGRLLLENYTDSKKVQQLISLGDLSFLGEEIGEKHNFDTAAKEHHEWCCAYHRDRDDDYNIDEVQDQNEFLGLDRGTEFWYLFTKDGTWVFASDDNKNLGSLTMEDCKD